MSSARGELACGRDGQWARPDIVNKIGWPGLENVYRVDFRVPDGTAAGTGDPSVDRSLDRGTGDQDRDAVVCPGPEVWFDKVSPFQGGKRRNLCAQRGKSWQWQVCGSRPVWRKRRPPCSSSTRRTR